MASAVGAIDDSVVDSVVGEILESMAFAMVERGDESEFDWTDAALVWARVDLIAPFCGEFWMAMPRDEALALTDAVWSGEAEATNELATALLAEIVNAVAGQLLAVLDPQADVQIGLPTSGVGAISPPEFEERQHMFRFDDGSPLGILVRATA